MRTARFAVVACCALVAAPLASAEGLDWFKSKAKAGKYQYTTEMEMSGVAGMPPGMGKRNMTFESCITQEDIDKGQLNRSQEGREKNDCQIRNVSSSGNSGTYSMVCTQPRAMTMDFKVNFVPDGYHVDMTMNMNLQTKSAGSTSMKMVSHSDAKYLGACTK